MNNLGLVVSGLLIIPSMLVYNARKFNIESNHRDFRRFNFGLERLIVCYVSMLGLGGIIGRGMGVQARFYQKYE